MEKQKSLMFRMAIFMMERLQHLLIKKKSVHLSMM